MPTAVITGGSSGIGLATALLLGARGYHVAMVARRRQALESAAKQVEAAGAEAVAALVADVSDSAQVTAAISEAHGRFGRIDVLVNNAGLAPAVRLATLPDEQWHAILDTNLSSAFYATRAVWSIME